MGLVGEPIGLLIRNLLQVTTLWICSKQNGFWIIVTYFKFLTSLVPLSLGAFGVYEKSCHVGYTRNPAMCHSETSRGLRLGTLLQRLLQIPEDPHEKYVRIHIIQYFSA